jgi:putative tricarboxylic transport membrane protein
MFPSGTVTLEQQAF